MDRYETDHEGERMPVHLTADQIADALGAEPRVVVNAARELSVPVFEGRIDSVLFAEALAAAGHRLAVPARVFLP